MAASLICALAPSTGWLIVARSAQGLGAALLTPNSLALLGSAFEGEARGRAIGVWSSAGALGPLVGGQIVDTLGWRYIFFVNGPIGLVAAALAVLFIDDGRNDVAGGTVDWAGAATATFGIGAATYALTSAVVGSGSLGQATIGAAAVALLAAFVTLEAKAGDNALAPPALFAT